MDQAAAADHAEEIGRRLNDAGIAATKIGEIVSAEAGCSMCSADGTRHPLPQFARDEIARLFDS